MAEPTRFWNRKFSGTKTLAFFGFAFALFWGWLCAGDRIADIVWDIRNGNTARLEGTSIKVPFLWRQEEIPAGWHELDLRKSDVSIDGAEFPDDITITPLKSDEATAAARMMRVRDVMARIKPSDQTSIADYVPDGNLKSSFSCLLSRTPGAFENILICVSVDNTWQLRLTFRNDSSLVDANAILHTLASTKKAS